MTEPGKDFISALRFPIFTAIYDPVVALLTRETRFKALLLDVAALAPGQRLLDVGCGSGTLAILAKQRQPSLAVYGMDADPAMLRQALIKTSKAGLSIDYKQALAMQLPYPDTAFDRVLSSLFFHHLSTANKLRTLREIHRVLDTAGRLYIADWGAPSNWLMYLCFGLVRLLDGMANTRANVRGQLPDLMLRAGFRQVQTVHNLATPLGTIAVYTAIK